MVINKWIFSHVIFQQFMKQLVQNSDQHATKSQKCNLEFVAPLEKLELHRIDLSLFGMLFYQFHEHYQFSHLTIIFAVGLDYQHHT